MLWILSTLISAFLLKWFLFPAGSKIKHVKRLHWGVTLCSIFLICVTWYESSDSWHFLCNVAIILNKSAVILLWRRAVLLQIWGGELPHVQCQCNECNTPKDGAVLQQNCQSNLRLGQHETTLTFEIVWVIYKILNLNLKQHIVALCIQSTVLC